MRLSHLRCESPLGPLCVVTDAQGALVAVDFEDREARLARLLARHRGAAVPAPAAAPSWLSDAFEAYFDGELRALHALPRSPCGTAFQRAVWEAVRHVPPGETTSYGALARALGSPRASRAVGMANGKNPLCLVVPCHRVIGADGALRGYAGGVDRKRWLLTHEARRP